MIACDTPSAIEALALPDERPADLRQVWSGFAAAYCPQSPGEDALIEQMAAAQIALRRARKSLTTLLSQHVREAEVRHQFGWDDSLIRNEQLIESDPKTAVRLLKRAPIGCSFLIDKWLYLKRRLQEDSTLLGMDVFLAIQLQGYSPVPDDYALSEQSFLTYVYCVMAQPAPKPLDIALFNLPEVMPKRFQDKPPEPWPPEQEFSRAQLQALIDGELAALRALHEQLKIRYQEHPPAEVRQLGPTFSPESQAQVRLEREIVQYERAFQRAYDCFVKGRRQAGRTGLPPGVTNTRDRGCPRIERFTPETVPPDVSTNPEISISKQEAPLADSTPNDRPAPAPARDGRALAGIAGGLLVLVLLLVSSVRGEARRILKDRPPDLLARSWEGEAPSQPRSDQARTEPRPPRFTQGHFVSFHERITPMIVTETVAEKKKSTCSPARLAANRANAQKSTGPKAAGKLISRFNGTIHGMTATLPLVLPTENPEELKEWIRSYVLSTGAVTPPEVFCATEAGHCAWRIQRCQKADAAAIAITIDDILENANDRLELEVARLAERLPEDPQGVLFELRQTPAGIRHLLKEWTNLDQQLCQFMSLEPSQRVRAIYLMGRKPGELFDHEVLRDWCRSYLGAVYGTIGLDAHTAHELLQDDRPDSIQPSEFLRRLEYLIESLPKVRQGHDALQKKVREMIAELNARLPEVTARAERKRARQLEDAQVDESTSGMNRARYEQIQLRGMRTALAELERLQRMRRAQEEAGEGLDEDVEVESRSEATADTAEAAGTEAAGSSEVAPPAQPASAAGRIARESGAQEVAPDRRE